MGLPIVYTAAVTGLGMTRDDGRENTRSNQLHKCQLRKWPQDLRSYHGFYQQLITWYPFLWMCSEDIRGRNISQCGYNVLKIFLNIWITCASEFCGLCEKTTRLCVTTCQPSPFCCSYLCDNNHIFLTLSECMRAEEASNDCQKWHVMTGFARHTIITTLTPQASTPVFFFVCVCVPWAVITGCTSCSRIPCKTELHISAGRWASYEWSSIAGVMGTMTSNAVITPHYKLVIWCNSSQCHNRGDVHFKRCHVFQRLRRHTPFLGLCVRMTPTTPLNLSHTERRRCQTWWVISGDSVQPSRASTKLSLVRVFVCVYILFGEWRGRRGRHSDSRCGWGFEGGRG